MSLKERNTSLNKLLKSIILAFRIEQNKEFYWHLGPIFRAEKPIQDQLNEKSLLFKNLKFSSKS